MIDNVLTGWSIDLQVAALDDQVAQFHQGVGCIVKICENAINAVGVDDRRIDRIAFDDNLDAFQALISRSPVALSFSFAPARLKS